MGREPEAMLTILGYADYITATLFARSHIVTSRAMTEDIHEVEAYGRGDPDTLL
jgi:hypothetical protein